MTKIYVILIIDGIVQDVCGYAMEEEAAAVQGFKYLYENYLHSDPNNDPRFEEILQAGYIGFGNNGQSSIQMRRII